MEVELESVFGERQKRIQKIGQTLHQTLKLLQQDIDTNPVTTESDERTELVNKRLENLTLLHDLLVEDKETSEEERKHLLEFYNNTKDAKAAAAAMK
jgi:ribosomal protein RSM22 (predicted rRNA methylase)